MSVQRDLALDKKIESTPSDLLPVDASYTKYSYEKINVSGGNPSNWGPGSNLQFSLPSYDDSVWSLDESYLQLRGKVHVKFSYDVGAGPVTVSVPLSGFSTACIEKFFLSGLLEQVDVSYGGVPIKQLETTNTLYPLVHSVYTLMNSGIKNRGEAESLNFYNGVTTVSDAANEVKLGYHEHREWSVLVDAEWPYNCCVSGDNVNRAVSRGTETVLPFDVQANLANDSVLYKDDYFTKNHQYRSSLILNPTNTQAPTATGGANNNFSDNSVNMLMKLAFPFAETGFKTPANIPLKLNLRRSRDASYQFKGDSLLDAILASGTDITTDEHIITSSYELQIENLDLFVKRQVLSESQRLVLYESPTQLVDMPSWSGQLYDITSSTFTQNVSFLSTPQFVLIALVPYANISPPAQDQFTTLRSCYNTASPREINYQSLYINSSYGRIPEGQPYSACQTAADLGTSYDMRAYREFVKCLKQQNEAVVPFSTWRNNHTWYAFILNTDGGNPMYEASRKERSNITITAQLVKDGAVNWSDYKLVVIGMELNEMLISNLKNVALSV